MAKKAIKRTSNYIVFVAGLNTNATNAGEQYEAIIGRLLANQRRKATNQGHCKVLVNNGR